MNFFKRRKKNKRTIEEQNKHNEEIWKTQRFTTERGTPIEEIERLKKRGISYLFELKID